MHLANKRCRKLKQRIYVPLTCFLQIRKRWSRFSIQALNIMLLLLIWHERAFLYLSSSFNSGTTAEQVPLWVKNARMFPYYTGFWKGQFGEPRQDGHLKANRGWPSSVRHKRGLNFCFFKAQLWGVTIFWHILLEIYYTLQKSWIHRNIYIYILLFQSFQIPI